jgi:hypothetical protein
MSKNRKFQMLFTIVLIVTAFLATISAVNASAPSKADLAWPPRPDFWPLREESLRRSREAELARWQALAEHYQTWEDVQPMERSRTADTVRWEAMAAHFRSMEEAQNLERGRAADAARWTAIAEYYL